MTRVGATLLALGVSIALIVFLVEIRSDAASLFGPDTTELGALDTAAGRQLIVALASDDQRARNASAREIADMLADDPLVAVVRAGPASFSEPFLDWVWRHRFRLAAPEPADLTVAELSRRLAQARDALAGAEGMVIGDRMLRDPTGSFARLLERLRQGSQDLKQRDGIWQSRDDRAALIFVTLADRPFQSDEMAALSDRIRATAASAGVATHMLGPRLISAEVSAATERASAWVALMAAALLLLWLVWNLRSIHALFLTLMPLALGVAAACLAVQLIFGSVHIVALGFGGALIGLALDYPLHLLGHAGTARQHAKRLIL
ncbi:MAG: MMPL family transporter, partial [Alphaproteobacteria bacterium]|nr:MMPL family transporter [Alphaproteobacteria bacterium]